MKTLFTLLFVACCFAQITAQTFPYLVFHEPDSAYAARKLNSLAAPSVFQKEIDGELPDRIFYQDSLVTVLHSLNPQMPVHLLIVPNRRIPTMNDAVESDANLLGHMLLVAAQAAKYAGIAESGYRLAFNTNEDAGQSAFHLHLHVLGGTKTGPMVDPGWRNIRRRLDDPASVTPLEKRLLGTWTGQGMDHFGIKFNLTIKWEPDLQNQFLAGSFRMETNLTSDDREISEGKMFYRQDSISGAFTGIRIDSSGGIHAMKATYDGENFTETWDLKDPPLHTMYHFKDDSTLEFMEYTTHEKDEWGVVIGCILHKL